MKTILRLNEDDIEEKYIEQNGNIFEWLAHQAKSGVASAKMNLAWFSNCFKVVLTTGYNNDPRLSPPKQFENQ